MKADKQALQVTTELRTLQLALSNVPSCPICSQET